MFELGEIYQGRDNAMAKQWFRKAIEKVIQKPPTVSPK
jgi:hypothetical protein